MSHTKEPWDAGPNGINIIDPKTGFVIAFTHGNNLKRRGDIRRIVACVNACAGISNADLEMDNSAFINVFNERSEWKARAEFSFRERDKLTKQRDELLAALDMYERALEGLFIHCLSNGVFNARHQPLDCTALNNAHCAALAAIASAKGGA